MERINWYKKAQQQKILYIMRGISGSGKSTKAREVAQGGPIFSTDDFFGEEYAFDPRKLREAHKWNQDRSIEAMQQGASPIVIDNTNVQAWEAKVYAEAAQQYGYNVEIVEPDTPWKFDAEELAKKNTHGVPQKAIERMIQRWEPDLSPDDILNSDPPF